MFLDLGGRSFVSSILFVEGIFDAIAIHVLTHIIYSVLDFSTQAPAPHAKRARQ